MRNPKFHALLQKMAETHDRKNHDYASADNPYSNFEMAASIAGVSVAQMFRVMIGVKMARLVELENSGKEPNHESIQDTRLDLAVYAALMASYFEPGPAGPEGDVWRHPLTREVLLAMTPKERLAFRSDSSHAICMHRHMEAEGYKWACTRTPGHSGAHAAIDNKGGWYDQDPIKFGLIWEG